MKGNLDMIRKKKDFNRADIMCAIVDDIEANNLDAVSISINLTGPLVMRHLNDTPHKEIHYQAYFRVDR